MLREFHTPGGIVIREVTPEEFLEFCRMGDREALTEWGKEKWPQSSTTDQKFKLFAQILGLLPFPE